MMSERSIIGEIGNDLQKFMSPVTALFAAAGNSSQLGYQFVIVYAAPGGLSLDQGTYLSFKIWLKDRLFQAFQIDPFYVVFHSKHISR